jgi:hypothetical protein
VRFLLAIPTELAGGRYAAPAWFILGLGAIVVAGAVFALALRFRRAPRDEGPRSRPPPRGRA